MTDPLNTTAQRDACTAALLAGWSITLRLTTSGAYGKPTDPSGYMHATIRAGVAGPMLLVGAETWCGLGSFFGTLPSGESVLTTPLSHGRLARVETACLLVDWVEGTALLDSALHTVTGERACGVCGRTLTRSLARGFDTGDVCGGRTLPTLSERRGWGGSLASLLAQAGKAPAPLPTPKCNGSCSLDTDCPDCD